MNQLLLSFLSGTHLVSYLQFFLAVGKTKAHLQKAGVQTSLAPSYATYSCSLPCFKVCICKASQIVTQLQLTSMSSLIFFYLTHSQNSKQTTTCLQI